MATFRVVVVTGFLVTVSATMTGDDNLSRRHIVRRASTLVSHGPSGPMASLVDNSAGTDVDVDAAEVSSAGEVVMTAQTEAVDSASERRSEYRTMKNGMRFRSVSVGADAQGLGLYCEEEYNSGHSRPGTPRLGKVKIGMNTTNRQSDELGVQLGERLVKAADATDAMRRCDSFFSFGDYTWCNKAMPRESDYARMNVWGGKSCNVTGTSQALLEESSNKRELNNGQYTALSFGIEELDVWSELMSGMYFLAPRLFDCYVNPPNGPMFNDWHGNHSREKQCTTTRCYTTQYEINQECIDAKNHADCAPNGKCRNYKSLSDYLNGAKNLSAFVKMDVEGSEWKVLEDLLNNEQEMAKVRTIDMEVHITMMPNEMPYEKRVEIMEKLAKKFAVTGSTIQLVGESETNSFDYQKKRNPSYLREWDFPRSSSGIPLSQYCISFVNRALL
eukprot:TRINITY_DN11245_c0_g2_i1.p1 TRINITY_DN11245_c0_g2~~TRINITY_DN11245_c0_g2_i1.p1  ORF type:complete len:445 (-),score=95.23 TRINITY_DN11245_c0_g2_i1:320-1654(-)